MSNAVFPAAIRGLTYATRKAMEFATIIQTAPNFATTRIQQTRNPIWHFTLLYEYLFDDPTNLAGGLTQTDLRTMMGFIMARGGQFDDFLFTDPDDNFSGPALISAAPNTLAQLQVVTDGAGNYYSPVQRNLGGFYEDITDLNGGITVYANGVAQTGANYTLLGPGLAIPGSSFLGMYLLWTAGAPTGPVTAQFNFYFRVRLDSDTQTFDLFMQQLWTMGGPDATDSTGLMLVSSRTPAL